MPYAGPDFSMDNSFGCHCQKELANWASNGCIMQFELGSLLPKRSTEIRPPCQGSTKGFTHVAMSAPGKLGRLLRYCSELTLSALRVESAWCSKVVANGSQRDI